MRRIKNRHGKRIAKHRRGFFKSNAMFDQIQSGLVGIPFKCEHTGDSNAIRPNRPSQNDFKNSRAFVSLVTCHLSPGPYPESVSRKHKRIAELVEQHQGHELDQHYAGFFDCFNRQLFYEAHEVLEHIWLKDKHGPNGAFYKGLIQLAGAFVHLQKNHLRPAAALFKLALANLEKYPREHERSESRFHAWLDSRLARRFGAGGF